MAHVTHTNRKLFSNFNCYSFVWQERMKTEFPTTKTKTEQVFLFVSANDFQWFDAIGAELLNKCDCFYLIYIYRQNDLNTKYTKTELIPISFFAVFFV